MADPPTAAPTPHAGVRATWALGVVAVFLLAVEALTGLGLLFHYRPTPETAYGDLVDLREVSGFAFVRDLHAWGSHALVAAVLLHLLRVVIRGSYRPPRRRNWALGVALLALTMALAATGALLPWDETAVWSIATEQPVLGAGGAGATSPEPAVDGATLRRFYALHCGVLPALTIGLVVVHWRRARRDGERATAPSGRDGEA